MTPEIFLKDLERCVQTKTKIHNGPSSIFHRFAVPNDQPFIALKKCYNDLFVESTISSENISFVFYWAKKKMFSHFESAKNKAYYKLTEKWDNAATKTIFASGMRSKNIRCSKSIVKMLRKYIIEKKPDDDEPIYVLANKSLFKLFSRIQYCEVPNRLFFNLLDHNFVIFSAGKNFNKLAHPYLPLWRRILGISFPKKALICQNRNNNYIMPVWRDAKVSSRGLWGKTHVKALFTSEVGFGVLDDKDMMVGWSL